MRWKCPRVKQRKLWRFDVSGLKQVVIDGEENKKQDYVEAVLVESVAEVLGKVKGSQPDWFNM